MYGERKMRGEGGFEGIYRLGGEKEMGGDGRRWEEMGGEAEL